MTRPYSHFRRISLTLTLNIMGRRKSKSKASVSTHKYPIALSHVRYISNVKQGAQEGIFESRWHSESNMEAEIPEFVAGLVAGQEKKRR